MLAVRPPLIWIVAGAGLVLGVAGWSLAGGAAPGAGPMSAAEARLDRLHTRTASARGPATTAVQRAAADAVAHPVFSVGSTAVSDAVLRVDGVSISARRSAVLVSINGKPADWLERSATRDGVTLQSVSSTKAVFDTATGVREVSLGDKPPEPAAPGGGAPRG